MRSHTRILMAAIAVAAAAAGTAATSQAAPAKAPRVAVFVPGIASGSPIYEQLVAGARRAAAEFPGATVKVVEAGNNQADWLGTLSALVSSGGFDLIATSNPSMPELCAQAAASFPDARFFVADSTLKGNKAIHTVLYNQMDEGYIVGFLAGLASSGRLPPVPATHKAGMVIAQHYPTMDGMIIPGFEKGLKAADPAATLELREVGNWYDATKAADLAAGLFDSGAATILPIAGGASRGAIGAAKAKGRYALCFDDASGYQSAPGTVIGCAVLAQERLVYEKVKALLSQGKGSALYGKAEIVGAKEGYIDFDGSGAAYRALPAEARSALEAEVAKLKSGKLIFPATGF
jgi:riboflavin transport system substrate-binding protein